MTLDDIHNERLKLFANWLNAVGSGITITGGVAPLIASMLGFGVIHTPTGLLMLSSFVWILVGLALNWLARLTLRSLK